MIFPAKNQAPFFNIGLSIQTSIDEDFPLFLYTFPWLLRFEAEKNREFGRALFK